MEGVVARALKPSLRREFAVMKSSTQQVLYEELMSLNANNGVSCEDFSVDDLLDFSNGEFSVVRGGHNTVPEQVDDEEEEKDSLLSFTSSQDHAEDDSSNSNSSGFYDTNESDSIFACGLAVPTDDLAELEWVSHFVDDSAPELSLLYPATISEQTKKTGMSASSTQGKRRSEVRKVRPELTGGFSFSSEMPVKPRTKRQRSNGSRVWSLGWFSPAGLSALPSMPCHMLTKTVQNVGLLNRESEPPVKKQKKKPENGQPGGSMSGGGSQVQRRCSHCQVQKTPQWRAGPLGPKTLCNACGVRFKSGRLFPEYRPACSPTFSSEIHSNSHRKVLEIRKIKETDGPETAGPEPGSAQAQMIIPS